jgi:hypothetical protein
MYRDFDGRSRWLCSTTRGFGLRPLLKSTSADVPICGLRRQELLARLVLVLFCVRFGGLVLPHSQEVCPIARRSFCD